MIRNNLSTRPFYNVSAVRSWLAIAGAVVIAATAFNVSQVLRYSNSNTELVTRASNDEARAAELRRTAQRLRASVDATQVDAVSVDARQANELIDRRTFSWTELFNRFERTLPDDVRITAVHPTVDRDRRIVLAVNVLAREVDDVNQFMENLDQTNAFFELHSRQEQTNDEGQIESSLEMIYAPHGELAAPAVPEPAPAASAPAQGARR
ncbi:MAG TPA: PilN domain-containing protein [Vicinamibacterales bacterium]|nr:PilN domain-containing protein [Vicinamibacterales bacterium]